MLIYFKKFSSKLSNLRIVGRLAEDCCCDDDDDESAVCTSATTDAET
jgi:hypothetical protein